MIHYKIWKPNCKPVGILQIVHGMTEYIGRYDALAKYLNELGYVVCGHDLEGHGTSAYAGIPALHMVSWNSAVANLESYRITFKEQLTKEYGELPYYMLGFSLGSFLVRSHQMKYPNTVDKIILVGTGMPSSLQLSIARTLVNLRCSKRKQEAPSDFVRSLVFNSYNKKIPNTLTEFDWLFKSQIALEKYRQDANVQTKMTPKFFLEFLNGMSDLNKNEYSALAKKTSLPDVLFLYGEEDPVSEGIDIVEWRYRSLGAAVRVVKIQEMRHDILHDMCSNYACQVICDFLEEPIKKKNENMGGDDNE